MAARLARTSEEPGLTVYQTTTPPVKLTKLVGQVVYSPAETQYVHLSEIYGMVPYQTDVSGTTPHLSILYGLGTFSSGLPDSVRSRAWTFVLDGHTFYVLDLGTEGTFLYDISTQQWCKFITDGHNGWNLKNGIRWGTAGRILGGDEAGGYVWELDPDITIDEDFRQINHKVTGNITTRSRVFHAVESVRIAGSIGNIDDISGSEFSFTYSDDGGQTYSDPFIVELVQGDFSGEIAWTSMGSFMAPGRVFQFSDSGGLQRIDGADVFVEDFDDNELVTKTSAELSKRQVSRGN